MFENNDPHLLQNIGIVALLVIAAIVYRHRHYVYNGLVAAEDSGLAEREQEQDQREEFNREITRLEQIASCCSTRDEFDRVDSIATRIGNLYPQFYYQCRINQLHSLIQDLKTNHRLIALASQELEYN